MLVNLSNHSSRTWNADQLSAAAEYGEVVDFPFPDVPAAADEEWVSETADSLCREIAEKQPAAVLVQGEMSLAFAVVSRLMKRGITVVCATSERRCDTVLVPDGSVERRSVFRVVRFRKYTL